MTKTFFPDEIRIAYVSASQPHPDDTQYKISIGEKVWDGKRHRVIKVQMVYANSISGRRSPSYPLGTDDFQRIMTKAQDLIANR